MTPSNKYSKCHIGEPLIGTALKEELVANGIGADHLPFPIHLVRVKVYRRHILRQVHLRGVVTPCTEHQVAALLVKWVVRDVDLAHGFEDTTWLPVYAAIGVQYGLELTVVLVYSLGPGGGKELPYDMMKIVTTEKCNDVCYNNHYECSITY